MTNSDRMARLNFWRDAQMNQLVEARFSGLVYAEFKTHLDELNRLYEGEANIIRRAIRRAMSQTLAANDV